MDDCFFSVIIPCYNAERYIEDCINRLMSQTCKDFEVVIVDDNSTDSTYEKCIAYSKKFSNVNVYQYNDNLLKTNRGQAFARNFGISCARGDWIIFLDVDDRLDREALQTIKEKAIDTEVVFFDFLLVFSNKTVKVASNISEKRYKTSDFMIHFGADIQWQSMACIGNKAYKTKFLKDNRVRFDEIIGYYEDICFFLLILICKPRISFLNKTLYMYYQNAGSFSDIYRSGLYEYSEHVIALLENALAANNCKYQMEGTIHLLRLYFAYYAIKNEINGSGLRSAYNLTCNILKTSTLQESLAFNSIHETSRAEKVINYLMLNKCALLVVLVIFLRIRVNSSKEEKFHYGN